MKTIFNTLSVFLMITLLSGCKVETQENGYILHLEYTYSSHQEHWATTTLSIFNYYHIYYSYSELLDHQYSHHDYGSQNLFDISWILWDLGRIDSSVTGTLSESEIAYQIRIGNPILLQYGDNVDPHFLLIYGYDGYDRFYVHEPGFGTHVLRYSDLYVHFFYGSRHYWDASLVIDD